VDRIRAYASATTFRRALEERLNNLARQEATDVNRLRRQVAFDRLLARMFRRGEAAWVLKGGYAMELRFQKARTTRDLDFTVRPGALPESNTAVVLDQLQQAAAEDLRDFFEFLIGQPIMDLDAAPYGGARYPVQARMDGRVFAKFHVDVGIGDVLLEPAESVAGRDWLGFAGIPSPTIWIISKEQQLAEKLHAYTLPRPVAPNSRVRDLVDMVLLVQSGGLSEEKVLVAVHQTFTRRGTHALPGPVPPPPPDWSRAYAAFARECDLDEDPMAGFWDLAAFLEKTGLPAGA